MHRYTMTSLTLVLVFTWNCLSFVKAEIPIVCQTLDNPEDANERSLQRVRALCEIAQASRKTIEWDETDFLPNFDLNQIESEKDANQILKRFRRGRSSSSSGSRSSSSSSRSSSSSSRSSSGSRFFGGSRSSSSSSSSSSGSRFFSRSGSSSSGSGSRIFSRGSSSSSSSGSGSSGTRTSRVRETVRTFMRKPTSSGSGSSSLPGAGGPKPGIGDKFRNIARGGGGGGFSSFGGNRFGSGGSGGTGGNAWVRAGKTFLPHAVRFGKRYYQRRKYNKGMYAGAGAGAGYYAGSRMNNGYNRYYPNDDYGYPPSAGDYPTDINGQTPTVFYCLQQDLNTTLVNKTLDAEGFGTCNVSGKLVTCPIEIECKLSEADNCCEDEEGTPYCCGGPIPAEYSSQYGGYEDDDWNDASESLNQTLNIITAICIMLATICLTLWQRRE